MKAVCDRAVSVTTDYGTEAGLGFVPPSLCPTSTGSSPYATTASEASADNDDLGSLLDEGSLGGIGDLENVRTNSSLCNCCEAAPHTRGQRWCMTCHSDICGCFRGAKQQGEEAKSRFMMVIKKGGIQVRPIINDWKFSLAAYGRGSVRPPFDFMSYAMDFGLSSGLRNNNKLTWMTEGKYCSYRCEWERMAEP